MERLKDQVAVVTGAARGIGAATTRRLARDGARVAIFDMDGAAAEELAASMREEGYVVGAWRVNVTDREVVTAAMAEVHERWGRIDILVNNAGIVRISQFSKMSDEDWTSVIETHLRGSFLCSQVAQQYMAQQSRGRIIMISSIGALGVSHIASYSTAKAGVQGLGRSLAIELGKFGITVNTVAPGNVVTDMTRYSAAVRGKDFDQDMARVAKTVPLGRVGQPEEVAGVIAFLASDDAAYVSGQVIYVAGGPAGVIA